MFLKLTSQAIQRYRIGLTQYWMDMIIEQLMRGRQQEVAIGGQVFAVLRNPLLERELVIPGLNIVTNAGDLYYAQLGAGEAVTNDFPAGGLRLGDDNTAPTKGDNDVTNFLAGTGHTVDGTYPQTDDGDGDNSGAGVDVVTWRYSYTTAQGNANGIIEGAIVDNTTTPSVALTHFLFAAAFNKTASDTLKAFANHTMNGI
jgi:hypothetical protein